MPLINNSTKKVMQSSPLSKFDSCELFIALIKISSSDNCNLHLHNVSLLVSKPNVILKNNDVIAIEKDINLGVKEHSVKNEDRRFSFLSANPSKKLSFHCAAEIEAWQQSLKANSTESAIPFHSGWMGYFAYPSSPVQNHEEANHNEKDHETASLIVPTTIAEFNYYPWSICFDHAQSCFHLLGEPDQSAKDAYAWLLSQQKSIENNQSSDSYSAPVSSISSTPLVSELSISKSFVAEPFTAKWQKDDYCKAFSKVQSYLLAGDCYQVNLTHPFVSPFYKGEAIDTLLPLFNALKPSFGCYFNGEDCELVSMSPERFISINSSGKLEAKPIKGTIKRSNDAALDAELIAELSNSAKNKAENLMIVDLLRNDLSMSAIPGSVKVDKLFELESHPNVHHLVSTISAQLRPDISPAAAISSAFPGGSITGAPKKRAMEIIAELEVQPRSLYCGSFGYFSDTGNTDFNILIRSLEFRNNTITCWGGGGITVDSDCDDEYEESLTKIRRIMDTVENI
jgi:para-aminobenzoate synthetase component 1